MSDLIQEISTDTFHPTYRVNSPMTIATLLQHLHLDQHYFVVLINGKRADITDHVLPNAEITILPRIAGGARGAKRKVKTKEKKQKKPRNKNKSPMWTLEGEKVVRARKSCPKCGPATFLAEHYDRMHCGKCGYTSFK
jgi:small subunit ribosomal protein S27Ae